MKQRESGLPFDDIRNLVSSLPPLDDAARSHTAAQLAEIESEGKLIDICKWLSAATGRSPSVNRPLITLFAGTHALENELDDGKGAEKLLNDIASVSAGDSIINRLCAQYDVGLKVFDLALQIPVANISEEAALDEKSCAGTIAFGMEAIAGGTDLLCLASFENEISLSHMAIMHLLTGVGVDELLATRNTVNENVRSAIDRAISLAASHKSDPLEILRRLGGRETAALCGGILAARTEHIPLILSGSGAIAAASVLHSMEPSSIDHLIFAQSAQSKGLAAVVEKLGASSLLDVSLTSSPIQALPIAVGVAKSATMLIS